MNIGKYKALIDRQRGYLSFVNFLILVYLFVEKTGFHWWFVLLLPALLIFAYIDAHYIMPKEFDYLHRKSPVMKELLKK